MAISRPLPSSAVMQRNLVQERLRRRNVEHVRTLWWWGRHGKAWGSTQHEDIEERLIRYHKLMMHRYSKVLRRRAIWDRDFSPSPWAWCVPSRLRAIKIDGKDLSSTAKLGAKLEEHEEAKRDRDKPWEEYHKDFESFKAAVDRAIERDPYGTLFGKTLRSPPTENNSSWTSWSWIFDPKDIKEEKSSASELKDKSKEPAIQQSSDNVKMTTPSEVATSSEPATTTKTIHKYTSMKTQTIMTSGLQSKQISVQYSGEYVYDPISGRKVLKQTPPAASKESKAVDTDVRSPKPVTSSDAGKTPLWKKLFFTEHGAQIPIKIYEPKVYGFDAQEPTAKESIKTVTKAKKPLDFVENSRKRQFNQLRAATLGNTIDSSNFDQKWTTESPKEQPETKPGHPEEKQARISPAPDDTKPLFSGTTYAGRVPESDLAPAATTSEWLIKEGFQKKAPLTIPELAQSPSPPGASREPTSKLEAALDRSRSSAIDVPVKKFGGQLQPAIDRVKATKPKNVAPEPVTEKREDIDLLRASDVRAAARAARVTKQALEDKKREARAALEKDFGSRAVGGTSAEVNPPKPAVLTRTDILTQNLSNVWKHVKQYPAGIVAKTMRTIGVSQEGPTEDTTPTTSKSSESSQMSVIEAQARSSGSKSQNTETLLGLARSLKTVYEEERGNIDKAVFELRASQANVTPSQHSLGASHAKMLEPSVKPGVVRNAVIERHTQLFEPALAEVIDKAKSIKRELNDISLAMGHLTNLRSIPSTTGNRLSLIHSEPSAAGGVSDSSKLKPSKQATKYLDFESPFIRLSYDKTTDDLQVTSAKTSTEIAGVDAQKTNPMAAIGSLHNPGAFVKYFVELDKHGYELVSGSETMLVFEKSADKSADIATNKVSPAKPAEVEASSPPGLDDETLAELSLASLTSAAGLRKTIAVHEAAAQPKASSKFTSQQDSFKAARVLDNIPSTIPVPGPSAPIAPPTSRPVPSSAPANRTPVSIDPTTTVKATSKSLPGSRPPRVRRQEQVFSGQRLAPVPELQAVQPDPTAHFPSKTISAGSSENQHSSYSSADHERPGFFRRFGRAVRRVVLTALAFGTGAYAIGVVAEGLGAQAQRHQIAGEGPRKKIVMPTSDIHDAPPRQRPGIFSTEGSR